MLHLRVIAPEHLREQILDVLRAESGVGNLLLFPGAAIVPTGDEITADVARESVNRVIRQVKELNVQHEGAITLHSLETVLSTTAHRAEEAAEGEGADALIWDELITRTREDSTLTMTFLLFMILACLLAAIGVATDSAVTIVGAMVVGPEFGPLAALSVALVQRRAQLARRAALALLVGLPVAMAVTAFVTMGAAAIGLISIENVTNVHQVDFIYRVGPASLIVALLAGAAGMLSLMSSKSGVLVGVFISVTTVPAAGFAVVAAVLGDWPVAGRSALQLLVNLVGIVVAGVAVLMLRPTRSIIPRSARK
ncbi:DUF389 domain-containing protein [Mycolicibacterium sp. Dal123E01]|uniref:DUF389 domain-containing protein n=1 Tax=Mycolicibacterium sp. Dal123E01 TaxID=3457578 RepID=UPI00403EA671